MSEPHGRGGRHTQLHRGGNQIVPREGARTKSAEVPGATEQRLLEGRQRAVGRLDQAAHGKNGGGRQPEIASEVGAEPVHTRCAPKREMVPTGCREHGVAGEGRVGSAVEGEACAVRREVIVDRTHRDVGPAGPADEIDHGAKGLRDVDRHLVSPIGQIEVRIVAARHRRGCLQPRHGTRGKMLVDLYRRALGAAPSQRNRHHAVFAEHVHEAEPPADGDAVPVHVVEHGQHHEAVAQPAEWPGQDAERIGTGPLANDDDERDIGRIRQGSAELPDLDIVESPAAPKPLCDQLDGVRLELLADGQARERDHLGVRRPVVPVYPYFAHHFGRRGCRCRLLGMCEVGSQDQDQAEDPGGPHGCGSFGT